MQHVWKCKPSEPHVLPRSRTCEHSRTVSTFRPGTVWAGSAFVGRRARRPYLKLVPVSERQARNTRSRRRLCERAVLLYQHRTPMPQSRLLSFTSAVSSRLRSEHILSRIITIGSRLGCTGSIRAIPASLSAYRASDTSATFLGRALHRHCVARAGGHPAHLHPNPFPDIWHL